jgi:hypothetical protein
MYSDSIIIVLTKYSRYFIWGVIALPFVKKIYNKIQNLGMWMFGSLAGFVIMWYRRQIFFWSGTQNISAI